MTARTGGEPSNRQAELINYRKRVERERTEVGTVAQAGVQGEAPASQPTAMLTPS